MMLNTEEYGKALFMLTEELGSTERVMSELSDIAVLFRENSSYPKLLDTPALTKDERLGLIDGAFSSFDENLVNTLKILCEGRSLYSFGKLYAAYLSEYDGARGIERVDAVTAVPMSDEQIAALTEKLEDMTGKTVIIKNRVDESILGGMRLRYLGKQLDGSLKTRLNAFRESLKKIVI